MRITAEAKAETKDRILEVATKLFTTAGWENTTTRGIASRAGIAAGTLFNYFESKEAIVAALMSVALQEAQEQIRKRGSGGESIEEDLFSLIWTELRSLSRYRVFLPVAAESIFGHMSRSSSNGPGESLRVKHFEAVEQILAGHGISTPRPLTMELYWILYLGVFTYWATDNSPKQEDTLALLDQSLKLFVTALNQTPEREKIYERKFKRSHRRPTRGNRKGRTKRR